MGLLKRKGLSGILLGTLVLVLIFPVYGAQKTIAAYIAEGKEFLKLNNLNEALASFTEALQLDPKSTEALINRGNAYTRKGYYDKAIEDYTEIIRLDPQSGKAYNNRAVAHWYNDAPDRAQEDMNRAKELGITVNLKVWEALRGSQVSNPVTPKEVQNSDVRGKLTAPDQKKTNPPEGKP